MKLGLYDIKYMVSECIEKYMQLTETKAIDVYNRFYSDVLPKEWWDELTKGTENITPFHRAVANTVKQFWEGCDKHEYQKAYAMQVCKLAQEAWNSSETARQFLTNAAKEDYYKFQYGYIEQFLRQVKISNNYSENEFIDKGLYKIFENQQLLVTCTLSYSASHRYYGDTHWCTASDIAGDYNGFEMFKNYTCSDYSDDGDSAILVQFCSKKDRANTYQVQMYGPSSYGQICDFNDNPANFEDIENYFHKPIIKHALNNINSNFDALKQKTREYVASEDGYYNLREYVFITHRIEPLRRKINSSNILEAITYDFNHSSEQQSGSFQFYFRHHSQYKNNFLCTVKFKLDEEDKGNGDIDTEFFHNRFNLESRGVDYIQPDDDEEEDDYDDEDQYEYDEDGNVVDNRPVGKAYFTPDDVNLIKRAMNNRSYRFDDVGSLLVLFRYNGDGTFTALKSLGMGYFEDRKNAVAQIAIRNSKADDWIYQFIRMEDGAVLFCYSQSGGYMVTPYHYFEKGDSGAYYITKPVREETPPVRLIAIIYGESAQVVKINKPLYNRAEHMGWGSPEFYLKDEN